MSGGSTTWSSTLTRMRSFMSMLGSPDSPVPSSLRPLAGPAQRTTARLSEAGAHSYAAPVLDTSDLPLPLRSHPVGNDRYAVTNTGDAERRDVVFGGQLLAQAIIATSLRHP